MSERTCRDFWPAFRVSLVDQTAPCLADQQASVTGGARPPWDALTSKGKKNLAENISGILLAQDQAVDNLATRRPDPLSSPA